MQKSRFSHDTAQLRWMFDGNKAPDFENLGSNCPSFEQFFKIMMEIEDLNFFWSRDLPMWNYAALKKTG